MKLTQDDFKNYRIQQINSLKVGLMAMEANKVLIAWLDKKIKKDKIKK